MNFKLSIFFLSVVLMYGCSNKKEPAPLFKVRTAKETGLNFTNTLHPDNNMNMMQYMYYYNGAGVAAADFNNDGYTDLFFASNQEQNRLYLNKKALKFEEVTQQAQIPNDKGWSTGVSVVDINQDGLLDIYVCRVGKFKTLIGKNQLLVCKEIKNNVPIYIDSAAQYGLDFQGFSTQAAFADFDLDGDLDMFLLNHSVNHDGNFAPRANFLNTYDSLTGDRIFRNDNNKFVDITKSAGINSNKIGYGLGIVINDINLDGYPDIYIGNDFHENDYLYINQKNGSFKETSQEQLMHTSQFTMGVDVADINNDALPDIVSMDMLPSDPEILKRSLGEDEFNIHKNKLKIGYHYQYARNQLQLNRGNGKFSEIGFYSNMFATDWSWSALLVDFDADRKKDLFVSNGIPKRLNDIDYVNFVGNEVMQNKIQQKQLTDKDFAVIEKFPEIKLPNVFFKNNGEAKFSNISNRVQNAPNTFSNGAAYADFDNDGDYDFVVNNIKDPVLIYENLSDTNKKVTSIKLNGAVKNRNAIGAKIVLYQKDSLFTYDHQPVRGFLSSMEVPMLIPYSNIDSAIIVWPNGTYMPLQFASTTQQIIEYKQGLPKFNFESLKRSNKTNYKFTDITNNVQLDYVHEENDFNEFNREQLLPRTLGSEGPAAAVGDINNDGLEDIFIGGAKWKIAKLFLQTKLGTFIKSEQPSIAIDSTCEDVYAQFADMNNDGFKDLLVASGGNEFYGVTPFNQPRLYLNNKQGQLIRAANLFTDINTTQATIQAIDFNNDGWLDIFIGTRAIPFQYGEKPQHYCFLNNKSGGFTNVTQQWGAEISKLSFITCTTSTDLNNDKKQDLIITTEWDGIYYAENSGSSFKLNTITSDKGWWNNVLVADIDGDGDKDILAGNQGLNSRVQPNSKEPLNMYYADFDKNGKKEQVVCYYVNGKEIPLATKMDMEKQMPYLKKKFLYAADFSKASISNMFSSIGKATKFEANNFSNSLFVNNGNNNFTPTSLPWQAQLSSFLAFASLPQQGDFICMGNKYNQNIALNRNDADFGTLLSIKGKSIAAGTLPGLEIVNEVKHILPITIAGKTCWLIVRNNDKALVVEYSLNK